MEKIKDYIENGDLDLARKMIESLENKLAEESSSHTREILKSQILNLKRLYSSKLEISLHSTKYSRQKSQLKLDMKSDFSGNYDKLISKCINYQYFTDIQCKNIDLIDCNEIMVKMIECEETVFLKNVKNSEITLKTGHLRVSNCENLCLYVYSNSGIFILDSINIKIEPILNCKLKVFDFNSPFCSKNFQILNK
ncbi:uncharacterized protein VICG_01519 [Vittaforma corneae ATCC 50505]|uniref:Tubulin binding cofactor C-like domain-containing protein n=1 Tax=Vittaforma corneae (strain ATCC 50505) TaxID=993615 RepID=L2GL94_VITCO|nr:uncharacterized protein VICG_01519 [Vittaforma corneae ATCC 50505]ELA41414.1 hypothetical protein VICG_01519 [Vittaforma corneae ATCC 50505]